MTTYKVTGGVPLRGKIQLCGAKNAGFKAMIASLLAETPTTICDLGLISEIDFAKKVISSLGGKVSDLANQHCLTIDPTQLNSYKIPTEIGQKSRSSTMYVGPLLKKFFQAVLPIPGGDVEISKRPIERHIEGLTALGANIQLINSAYIVSAPQGLSGTRYRFAKNTHTGTETLLMCAVYAHGETILENAATEPEVDELITLLNSMGGQIMRLNPRTIRIVGVDHLRGVKHSVMKDRIEAATFACMALATKGDILVKDADPLVLTAFLEKVNEAGGRWEKSDEGIRFWHEKPLRATDLITAIYPGFMTDWQPLWSALMTQASGQSTVHETVHQTRFGHVSDLSQMGAKISYFNPPISNPEEVYNFNLSDDSQNNSHGIKIDGPTQLKGTTLEITDIRRGATALLAGLVSEGTTILKDPKDQIKRGYENLVGRLQSLGAKIEVQY